MSFEVYIWHYPFMAVEQMFTRISGMEFERGYITMFVFMLIKWIIAYPLYRFVETPMNRKIKEKSK